MDTKCDSLKEEAAWNLMRADTPYIPSWVYQRPAFSKYLNLGQISIDPVFGNQRKQQLGSLPVQNQEILLIEDILDIMLGVDGVYIKKNSHNQYIIEPQK